MADYNQQRQVALQHLAHLRQDLVPRQGVSVLQPQAALAEAALEAHLQHQRALVEIQALEHQRLDQQHHPL